MLAYTLIALVVTVLAHPTTNDNLPQCIAPSPPASQLPDLADCLGVLRVMNRIARGERNVPQVWARQPRAPGHGYWLPYSFSSGLANNCDLVVNAPPGKLDIFSTKYMVTAADELIRNCLIGTRLVPATVGTIVVGPRGVVELTLKRKIETLGTIMNGIGNMTSELGRKGSELDYVVQDG